jgi:hypothetical protein
MDGGEGENKLGGCFAEEIVVNVEGREKTRELLSVQGPSRREEVKKVGGRRKNK